MADDEKPSILYAEDDYDDFSSIKEALEQLTQNHNLIHAKNGEDVLSFIQNENFVKPSLIVLDLNMPVMNGKEVLIWLKEQDEFKKIPVMVFTTSSREEDIKVFKDHGCTFFRKPTLYRDLLHIVQEMLNICDEYRKSRSDQFSKNLEEN